MCFRKYCSCCIVIASITVTIFGQDTVYLDIRKATDLLKCNNALYTNEKIYQSVDNKIHNTRPTEFDFEYGQLYSPDKGWKLEITQDFGNFVKNNRIDEERELEASVVYADLQSKKKKLEIKVKSLFLEWIYLYNLYENHKLISEYSNKKLHVSGLKAQLGDTEPINALTSQAQVSKLETQLKLDEINLVILQNNIKKFLNTNSTLLPINRKLDLYMIAKPNDTTQFTGAIVNATYLNEYHLAIASVGSKKAAFYPNLKFGVFLQDLEPYSPTTGVKASISIPLWLKPYKQEVKNAQYISEIKHSQYLQSQETAKLDIENLLLQLDKCFLQIRHYQNYALPESNLLLSTTVAKYQHEEIDYDTYLKKVEKALTTKQEYLQLVNTYNQTAVQLELYLK